MLQLSNLLLGFVAGGAQRIGLLPCRFSDRVCGLVTQGIPARLPMRNLRCNGCALRLLVLLLALGGGQRGVQLLALLLQCITLLLRLLERSFGGRNIERSVFGDRRVFVRSAQRAGLMGLQCGAVGLKALNTLLLR